MESREVGSTGVRPHEVDRSSMKTYEVDGIRRSRKKWTVVVPDLMKGNAV